MRTQTAVKKTSRGGRIWLENRTALEFSGFMPGSPLIRTDPFGSPFLLHGVFPDRIPVRFCPTFICAKD